MDERQELFDLWLKHGTTFESDSSEGWELVDAIQKAGYRKLDALADEAGAEYKEFPSGAAKREAGLAEDWLRAKARKTP